MVVDPNMVQAKNGQEPLMAPGHKRGVMVPECPLTL